MDPYQVPESELIRTPKEPPKSLVVVYVLLASAFVLATLDSMIIMAMDGGSILDFANNIFILLWLGVLVWIGSDISKGKNNPKWLMLLLPCIVISMAVFDNQGFPLIMFSVAESCCYLAIFTIIRKPEYSEWFSGKNA